MTRIEIPGTLAGQNRNWQPKDGKSTDFPARRLSKKQKGGQSRVSE